MKVISLHHKNDILAFLTTNPELHIYSIGDLDDFFWPYTNWFALVEKQSIQSIALLYFGLQLPCLLAIAENIASTRKLLEGISHLLPHRFYAHLSSGVEQACAENYQLEAHGQHYKMALTHKNLLTAIDDSDIISLNRDSLDEILALYRDSYPENWFEPQMLDTGQYYGIKDNNKLVSIAGVHVFSKKYQVAALGNITTHPHYRNRKYGRKVTGGLCKSLLKHVSHIGLNVESQNTAAIKCYQNLGFEVIASYQEFMIKRIL